MFTSLRQFISSFGEKNTIKKKERLEETKKEPPKKISKIDPEPDKKVKEIKEGKNQSKKGRQNFSNQDPMMNYLI